MKIYDKSKFEELPAAFLFDTDNTLYSYDQPHSAAMNAVKVKVMGMFSITGVDFDGAFSSAREQVKKRLVGQASSHSRLLYMQRMLELLGLGSQVLTALDLEQTYWRTFLGKAVLFDGVRDLLDDIRILGIPAVVVTDL
ncbi:MAG: phosphoglycolate phosphatase-like HAD superfamily hydrolase, partial [Gammaproteobacteria bacterium]